MQTSTLAVLGGGVIAVSVAAAVYLRPLQDEIRAGRIAEAAAAQAEETPVDTVAGASASLEPVTPAETVSTDDPAAPQDAEPAQSQTEEQTPTEEASPVGPVLTTLRFEPDGAVLVSGTADPLSEVSVLLDGAELERISIGADGGFFFAGFLGFSDGPRVLSVIGDPEGAAVAADRSFVLAANPGPAPVAPEPEVTDDLVAVNEAAPQEPAPEMVDVPEPQGDPAVEIESVVAAVDDEVATAVASEMSDTEVTGEAADGVVATAEAAQGEVPQGEAVDLGQSESDAVVENTPATPAILAVTDEGVEVVQAPVAADTPPEVMSTVALDTITYDQAGEVQLQGRALGQGFVQVYVDNAPVSRLVVDETGSWRGDLPDVDKGVYTLRIDEIDTAGDVVSRIETPFLREDPETVAEALADEVEDPSFTVATRTVQPGATLWAIAQERYGEGTLFVTVFEANKDRIRDPDLIYPGQVFVLPEDGN